MIAKKRLRTRLSILFLQFIFVFIYSCKLSDLWFSDIKFTQKEKRQIVELEKVMKNANSKYNFNGSVLVGIKDKIIFNQCYGFANFDEKDTLTTSSIFQLASLSKQFTAMGIMILKESGKLKYDDKVKKFIPKFPYPNITIRHLLNHTSGLPNYLWLVDRFWNLSEPPYNDDAIRILIAENQYLNFNPGEKFQYSNTNYVVLASIIEKISKMRFGDFLDKNIFKPLDMKNTFVYSTALKDNENRKMVPGYRHYSRGYRKLPKTKFDGIVGDKGIYSTTGDLYRWDQALYNEKIVDKETLVDVFSNGMLKNGKKVKYGFGFRIKKDKFGNRIIYHNGLWEGFRNSIIRNTQDKTTIIILEHTNCRYKYRLLRKIERIVNKD
ncbi:MAG: serine hydrolase domain-containing protein [Candidatus Marinimicrobia bacterium]|nr:serine hydrolase domain-containing protein [Candidatus Neomarinimicrobiota bacterium]